MAKLIPPRLNINGTSKPELLKQYTDILSAIADLQKAMRAATPNGRDYQTLPMTEAGLARDAFNERQVALTAMYGEFLQVALAIDEQGE